MFDDRRTDRQTANLWRWRELEKDRNNTGTKTDQAENERLPGRRAQVLHGNIRSELRKVKEPVWLGLTTATTSLCRAARQDAGIMLIYCRQTRVFFAIGINTR